MFSPSLVRDIIMYYVVFEDIRTLLILAGCVAGTHAGCEISRFIVKSVINYEDD